MKSALVAIVTVFGTMASAETFQLDSAASKVEWSAGKKIGGGHHGEVKVKKGEIVSDAKDQWTSGLVVIDMRSISNIDLKDSPEFQKKLVGHLSSDDFFKVDKFPEAQFKILSFKPKANSPDEFIVSGELTMIGKTETIEFPAKISRNKTTVTGTAKVTIERLKWGLKYGSESFFKSLTADKIINDTFDLTLSLVAKK